MTPDQLRARVAVYLSGTLGPTWTEAIVPYQLFPANLTRTKAHRSYAVGLGGTEPVQGHGGRQDPAVGVVVETDVLVRYACRVRAQVGPSDPVTLSDHDAALSSEAEVVGALLRYKASGASDPGMVLRFARVIQRDLVADGTYWLGEVRAVALHVYPA